MDKKKKMYLTFAVIAVICFAMVYLGISVTRNAGKTSSEVSVEKAADKLGKMLKEIRAEEVPARKAAVELTTTTLEEELPDISKYPLSVIGNTTNNIEIFSSPEKAGDGYDGWLLEVAEDFNNQGIKVNGEPASVSVRSIASGMGADYIISGKYLPDAFTPSNAMWGEMMLAQGADISVAADRLVGNVAGILLEKKKYDELVDKYGAINMKTITEATADSEIAMGYTNPLASSTGLNFLVSTLNAYDSKDLLSSKALDGFGMFQANVPFVAYTTMQMRDAVESGAMDGLILEYQTYINTTDLRNFVFTPFGARHDNPMYQVGRLTDGKKAVLDAFIEYCMDKKAQDLAAKYGFNSLDDYSSELPELKGDTLLNAQDLWKENKDSGRPVTAVFVADISGSMDGAPLNELKQSLINGSQYINSDNYVGLVSYNSNVYVNLPVGQFDLNQRSLFTGAVSDMDASGGTASFDAIMVALDMLLKAQEAQPNTKLMMFVLSDGETNSGYSLNDIQGVLKTYGVPVYTIGYNANISALETISQINEAANINADSDDVIYKLKSLFNAQM